MTPPVLEPVLDVNAANIPEVVSTAHLERFARR
jgi:hypothetical protein